MTGNADCPSDGDDLPLGVEDRLPRFSVPSSPCPCEGDTEAPAGRYRASLGPPGLARGLIATDGAWGGLIACDGWGGLMAADGGCGMDMPAENSPFSTSSGLLRGTGGLLPPLLLLAPGAAPRICGGGWLDV